MNKLENVRVNGLGNGFTVLNPADGYRKDNRLWFGECATCGERVTNSSLKGYWEHKLVEVITPNHQTWTSIDYCPQA